jgi:transcriptional regulator with PAS, ATPase and Fis domain
MAWIGAADLRAAVDSSHGLGPIAQALDALEFDSATLLSNYSAEDTARFTDWLKKRSSVAVRASEVRLESPTSYGQIYEAASASCEFELAANEAPRLTFHLSPGTPAMAAIWLLLAKTKFPGKLIESSREHGVREAIVPFDIAVDFLPTVYKDADRALIAASDEPPPHSPDFAAIVFRSPTMARVVRKAKQLAIRGVPVLIEGESGTGKELFARAIHSAGARRGKSFVAVNCGAIPSELVEAELFGHERGAFTGATAARKGYFESADGGTLFLDEIGELPLATQVKLLRVIQEGEVSRLGSSTATRVDVRIIAATNRELTTEVVAGRFREDLFFRVAVGVLHLPALRDRQGDLSLLIDYSLETANAEAVAEPGFVPKQLSAAARQVFLSHTWPGNMRELLNTIRRAVLWAEADIIDAADARDALTVFPGDGRDPILERSIDDGLDLQELIGEVARHYLRAALERTNGNKSKAARLLGFTNHQTFANWLERYEG